MKKYSCPRKYPDPVFLACPRGVKRAEPKMHQLHPPDMMLCFRTVEPLVSVLRSRPLSKSFSLDPASANMGRSIVIEILEAKDANGGALSLAGDDDEEADKKERSFLIRKPC